jgi:hypothetical protein
MIGVFVEAGDAGITETLTLVWGPGSLESMKYRIRSAARGRTMRSADTMTPSRVKRR